MLPRGKLLSAHSLFPRRMYRSSATVLKSQVIQESLRRSHLLLRHSVTSAPLKHSSRSIHMGTHTLQTTILYKSIRLHVLTIDVQTRL